jgi:hypothetical protein
MSLCIFKYFRALNYPHDESGILIPIAVLNHAKYKFAVFL